MLRRKHATQIWQLAGSGGGGGTTTFDPANTGVALTLSNGNLTASSAGTTTNWTRSVSGHTTGKFYAEWTITSLVGGTDINPVGIVNSSEVQTNYIGNSINSAGLWNGDTNVYINSASAGTSVNYASGNLVGMAVDIGGSLIWFRISGGNWNASGTANPATGVGGINISTITSGSPNIYASCCCNQASTISINFGGSAYSFTAPVGFGNW